MKTNKLVIGLLGLMIFTGCTGFNQDPLKSKEDAIRNAVPIDTKLESEDSITDGAVQIVVNDIITFKEGKSSSVDLKVKSFLAGYTYSFEILNSDIFKGAFINGANQLVWAPPAGLIPGGTNFTKLDMKLNIIAKPTSGGILKSSASIPIYIQNDSTAPIVKTVKLTGTNTIVEGTMIFMTVLAKDTSSVDSPGMQPKLNMKGKIEPYVNVKSTRYLAVSQEWEFELTADLSNADITRSIEAAPFYISVVDRFGNVSVPYLVNFTLMTNLGLPMSTFLNTTTLKADFANVIPFQIFDSNSEAVLTLVNTLNLPAGAVVNCESSKRIFQQCTLSWTPTLADVGRNFVITMEIQSRNSNPADTRAPKNNLPISFSVIQ